MSALRFFSALVDLKSQRNGDCCRNLWFIVVLKNHSDVLLPDVQKYVTTCQAGAGET